MKNAKKILILLLSLALVFALFACGKCEHEDANKDGVCDKCGEEVEVEIADVALIEDGVAKFQFVVETGVSSDVVKAVDKLIKALKEYDVEVLKVNDKEDTKQDVEVLIGDVTTRGDAYKIDKYALGPKGYVIKIVDSKILINAGSHAQLADAVEAFGDDILGLADEPDELYDVVMSAEQMVEEIQNDYRITSLKVNGVDMKGYTIAVDSDIDAHKTAAKNLQKLIYERTGYWFPIVAPNQADKSIIIQKIEKSADLPNGFEISVNDKSQIVIKCAFDNMLEEGISKLTNKSIVAATGDVEFKTGVLVGDFNACVISYEMYGAVGDGVTNDYAAVYTTHVIANEGGQKVIATPGKTYLLESPMIGGQPTSIPIRTDVDWQGAKFIVDDRRILTTEETKDWSLPLFDVGQDVPSTSYSSSNSDSKAYLQSILAQGLNRNTTKIDLGDNYRCNVMLITANATHKVYRRRGYGGYDGAVMEELILLDKDGNIIGNTEPMYDYIDLTGLKITKLDEVTPITIKNGEFTTRASQHNCIVVESDGYRNYSSPYIRRGFKVSRSYTTIENVQHYVTDEVTWENYVDENLAIKYVGPTYRGFFINDSCTDVTIRNCVLTGRRAYRRPNGGTGGTYDLSGNVTNNLVFENCVQSNFWVTVDSKGNIKPAKEGDPGAMSGMDSFPDRKVYVDSGSTVGGGTSIGVQMHWGIGGTNLCKNTKYINSTLSRYDAHEGTYRGEVIGSTVDTVAITGAGDFLIKDSRIIKGDVGGSVFSCRDDYGSTWDGTVYIENVSLIATMKQNGNYVDGITVASVGHDENWYWGYQPVVPNVVINDLYFYDINDYNSQTKAYAQVPADIPIYVYGKTIGTAFREHLSKTKKEPYYSLEDKDKDGYVDIPDVDGDGVWGNTTWKYDDVKTMLGRDYNKGFHPSAVGGTKPANGLYDNFAIYNPPSFVKVISNKGGYKYHLANTAINYADASLRIESGGYHGIEENYRGFFGSTKFYYGPGENDYYIGPPIPGEDRSLDNVFVFY